MACSSQLPTSQPGPALSPVQSYQYQPYQPYQPYQYQPYNPYTAHCDQYTQQCNPQPIGPVISPAENRVSVTDGYSWKEYNLENVFSGQIPGKESLPRGDIPENGRTLVLV